MKTTPQKNLLFLFSDQHRADAMGCAGHAHVKTPNLDRLANEGVRFANAYCATPLCFPSRISLATGRFPHNTGHNTNNEGYLYPDTPMLSHALHDAGYRTALLGKLHLAQCADAGSQACDDWCHAAGWDDAMPIHGKAWSCVYEEDQYDDYLRWLATTGKLEAFRQDYRERNFAWKFPGIEAKPAGYAAPSPLEPEEHQDGFITRKACEWLQNASPVQPWFCWVNWGGPHDPWDAPGKFGRMYDPAAMPPPIADTLKDAPEKLRQHAQKYTGNIAPEQWRQVMAQYYGSISFIDDGIGKILDTLERRGLLENTIVVYASDHGEMMFDHNMLTKWVMYEASSKVPLIVRLPGAKNHTVDTPVSLLDLVPTLLDLAGVDRQSMPVLHGRSLLSALHGEPQDGERPVFCEMNHTKMIRQGPWKYSTDPDFDVDQLFNLADDPNELNNLACDPAQRDRVETFRKEILNWMINTQNTPMPRKVPRASSSGTKVARASSSGIALNGIANPEQDALATMTMPDWSTLNIKQGEYLPHWTCKSAIYHVAFRLSDSVPSEVRDAWLKEREAILATAAQFSRPLSEDEEKRLQYLYSEKIEAFLDAGHGVCHMNNPVIANIVANALCHFDGQRYRLHAWSVMPNHVHVIVEPLPGYEVGKIVHSWKSFTANQANTTLNLTGPFWQHDPYDHIIRSEKEYRFQINYVWKNPEQAGLANWHWRRKGGQSF